MRHEAMTFDVPRTDFPRQRGRRVSPVRSPGDAASQIFGFYDQAVKSLGDRPVTPADAFYLSGVLRNLVDIRLTEAISDNVIEGIERRILELQEKFDALRFLK